MTLLRLIRFSIARSWEEFAVRFRIRNLPALPAAIAVVVLGVLVPLAFGIDTRPAALQDSLAIERLERLVERVEAGVAPAGAIVTASPAVTWPALRGAVRYEAAVTRGDAEVARETCDGPRLALDGLGLGDYLVRIRGLDADGAEVGTRVGGFQVVQALPLGEILGTRPALYWFPVEGARQYRVQVSDDEGVVMARSETSARAQVLPPSELTPGAYRLAVEGLGPDGHVLATREVSFRVAEMSGPLRTRLREVRRESGLLLAPAERNLVLAGFFAAERSPHDAASALESLLREADAAPEHRELALRVLTSLGLR